MQLTTGGLHTVLTLPCQLFFTESILIVILLFLSNVLISLSSRSPSGEVTHEMIDEVKKEIETKEKNITEEDIDEIESFEREEQRIQEEVERQVQF